MQILPSTTTPKGSAVDKWQESSGLEECLDAANGSHAGPSFGTWTSSSGGEYTSDHCVSIVESLFIFTIVVSFSIFTEEEINNLYGDYCHCHNFILSRPYRLVF